MCAANKGKIFEKQWKTSAEKQGLFILRLNDSSLSWQHEHTSRFQCMNPCDYIMYYNKEMFALELKSTEYNSISIEREKGESAMIKLHQWNSLSNFSTFEGVNAGFILNFRNKDNLDETTYWLSIQDFNNFMCESEKKSINKLDIIDHNGIVIQQKLLRTNYIYGVQKMLQDIQFRKEV